MPTCLEIHSGLLSHAGSTDRVQPVRALLPPDCEQRALVSLQPGAFGWASPDVLVVDRHRRLWLHRAGAVTDVGTLDEGPPATPVPSTTHNNLLVLREYDLTWAVYFYPRHGWGWRGWVPQTVVPPGCDMPVHWFRRVDDTHDPLVRVDEERRLVLPPNARSFVV